MNKRKIRKRYMYNCICFKCKKEFNGFNKNSKYCSVDCYRSVPKKFSKMTLKKEEVYDLYFNKKMSFYKIEKETKANRNSIIYWFKKWGFIARNKSESQKGKLNHGYKDGLKDNTYRAYLRDNKKCKLCEYDRIVNIHHIIPRCNGGKNNLNNLITLCPNCHCLVHQKIIKIYSLSNIIDSKKKHEKYGNFKDRQS